MSYYRKAIVAALVAGLSALVTAWDDNVVTAQEWTMVVLATVVAFGAVWGVPNTLPPPPLKRP